MEDVIEIKISTTHNTTTNTNKINNDNKIISNINNATTNNNTIINNKTNKSISNNYLPDSLQDLSLLQVSFTTTLSNDSNTLSPSYNNRYLNMSSVMNNPLSSSYYNNNYSCFSSNDLYYNNDLLIPPPNFYITSENNVNTIGMDILQKYLNNLKEVAIEYGQNHAFTLDKSENITFNNIHYEDKELSSALKTCMDTIPSIFFNTNFKVSDTDIFKQANNHSSSIGLAALLQLPDTYMQYLDMVEMNLLKQISSRFDSFNIALKNIQSLYIQVGKICASITKVRDYIATIRNDLVTSNIEFIKTKRRIKNVEDLSKKLESIRSVKISIGEIEAFIQTSKYEDAEASIAYSHEILKHELSNIQCMANMPSTLNNLQKTLITSICDKMLFCSLPTHPTSLHLISQLKLCFSSWKLPLFSTEINFLPDIASFVVQKSEFSLQEDIKVISFSNDLLNSMACLCNLNASDVSIPKLACLLNRFSYLKEFLSEWKKSIETSVKEFIKNLIVIALEALEIKKNILENIAPEQELTLAQRIEKLNHYSFLQLLSLLFRSFSSFFLYLSVVKVNILSSISDSKLIFEVNDCHDYIAEFIHGRLSKIIDIKHSAYSRSDFVECSELIFLCNSFLNQFEYLSSLNISKPPNANIRSTFSLKNSMGTIFRDFLSVTQERFKSELSKNLCEEVWTVSTILIKYDVLVKDLEVGKYKGNVSIISDINPSESVVLKKWDDEDEAKSKVKVFTIGNESYYIANVVLSLLDIFESLLNCVKLAPSFAAEVTIRVCDLFKLFNTKTHSLVLGAEAMKTAGLKSITAKHLALSSQCVAFMSAFLPIFKKTILSIGQFSENISKTTILIDNLILDFQSHRTEIFNKLVDILMDLISRTSEKLLSSILSALRLKMDSLAQSVFELDNNFVKLMDSTKVLHKALSSLLPINERNSIFSTISDKSEIVFSNILNDSKLKDPKLISRDSDLIKKKIYNVNIKYFITEFRKLDGSNELCNGLEEVLNKL